MGENQKVSRNSPNLVKSISPPLSGQKFNFFYSLPVAMSSDLTPRTPCPSTKKMMKKNPGTTVILRRASVRINNNRSFRFKEPRSPKVSCFGKVANNGKKKDQKKRRRENDREGKEQNNEVAISPPNLSLILKLFRVFKKKGTKLANPYAESSSPSAAAASIKSVPKSCNAKNFFVSFDWRVHDSSSVSPDLRPSSLPNKRKNRKDVVVVENIELVPRKEINLWKKRMVAPPPPLLV